MRITLALAVVCFSLVTATTGKGAQAAIRRPTNIPAQELATALRILVNERDAQLVYRTELVRDHQTGGAAGDLTFEEALTQLLSGTGLTYRYLGNNAITIVPIRSGSSSNFSTSGETEGSHPSGKGEDSTRGSQDKEGAQSKGVWDRFRWAQVNQRTSSVDSVSSSALGGDQNSSRTNPNSDTSPGSQAKLEEVIVTATRREEFINRVPASISALSQADLYEGDIKGISDVAAITPGLQLATPYGASFPSVTTIAIRGLNTLSGASLVGIYLDDTPISVRLSADTNVGSPYPAVFDLNRVEVERGPQGTLFGAGSEAGTVRFITNQPNLTAFSGFAHSEFALTEGGSGSYEVGAAVGGPIVPDTVGFRVSLWGRHDGGYVDRIDPFTAATVDPNSNQHDTLALKAALAFQVNKDVRVTPSVFYESAHTSDSDSFYGNFSNPSAGQFKNGRLLPARSSDRFFVPSVKVESHLPFAEFTSVTSYMNRSAPGSLDASPVWGALGLVNYGNPLGPAFPGQPSDASLFLIGHTVNAYTEEVRLASNRPDAFVTWVGGVFYDHRYQNDVVTEYSAAVDPVAPLMVYSTQPVTDDQIALFAQGDFHLTKTLTATLGERVARLSTDQTSYQTGYLFGGISSLSHSKLTQTPTTPRVALYYRPDEENLFYVSASNGFRAGGGNAPLPITCTANIAPDTYKADKVWSYELGAKNRFWDGRLQIDSSVFHVKWSEIQQLEYIGSCAGFYTANTGGAVSNGFDLAVQALVTATFRVNLDVGYANAYFSSTVYDSTGNPLVLKGDKIGILPQVNPPWDVNGSATYEIPLSGGERIHIRGEYQYHSRNPGPFVTQNPTSLSYFPLLVPNPPTHMLNGRVGVKKGKLDLVLFVDNITNTHPLLSMYQDTPTSNLITFNTFRPRTFGLSANIEF